MKNMADFHLSTNELVESAEPSNLEEYSTAESNSETNDDDDGDAEDEDEDDAFDDNDSDNDEYNSENEEFYFESDHLALRGNSDYRAVLRTIVVLESQRIEVAKHIDKIAEMKRRALQDPSEFIKKLASGQNLDISGPINIQNVSKSITNNHRLHLIFVSIAHILIQLPKIKLEKYNVSFPTLRTNTITVTNKAKVENDFTVRGRTFDQTKPVTFNQVAYTQYFSIHTQSPIRLDLDL